MEIGKLAAFELTDGVAGERSEVSGLERSPDFCKHPVPFVKAVAEFEFSFDAENGAEKSAADASESVGIADGNAVLVFARRKPPLRAVFARRISLRL